MEQLELIGDVGIPSGSLNSYATTLTPLLILLILQANDKMIYEVAYNYIISGSLESDRPDIRAPS